MRIKQVSVFLENRPGHMAGMLRALGEAEVDIRAMSVADTADYGIARLILSDIEKGLTALRGAGFTASTNEVLRADMPDEPGGLLHTVCEPLAEAGVNIEYLYAYVDQSRGNAVVVAKVSDLDLAVKILSK
jgi:hypothetical protein